MRYPARNAHFISVQKTSADKADTNQAPPRRRRRTKLLLWFALPLAFIALSLVILRLMLPGLLKDYANKVLARSPDYDGTVDSVSVHLWRGAYSIDGIKIVKTTGRMPVPFFESKRLDLRIDWHSLLQRKLRGSIRMDEPKLNFVLGRNREESQTGEDQPWLSMLDDLAPFRVDRAEVINGEVHLHTFYTTPKVNIFLSDLEATVENLTNASDKLDPLIATVQAKGTAMRSGDFEFNLKLDPESHRPNFEIATRVVNLDVRKLNDLARAFGGIDFEEGRFDLVVEATTKDGFLDGYAKPLFRDAIVLGPRDLESGNLPKVAWEAIVGAVGTILSNHERQQFGTRFAITGQFDDPKSSTMEVIGNVLRNAFVRAYLPNIEGRIAPAAADDAVAHSTKR
ncbi:MAG: DUF748 domain-containing protein [Phycisphaerales bacterium]